MDPLVSVIVPVYNTSAYLHRCLDSLCHQTYQNLEIICVNDGSTDNSLDILEAYARKDSRIKIISTDNCGLGAARNLGIENAKGEWVTGLDSDDYFELDACSYVINQIRDEIDVIQFGFRVKQLDLRETFNLCKYVGVHEISISCLVNHSCEFCGKFWRKDFLKENKCAFPINLWYEDYFFYWAYLPLARKILYLPECKYVIVKRGGSIMGQSNKKHPRCMDHIEVLKLLFDFRTKSSFSSRLSSLNLINFIQCWRFVESRLPDDFYKIAIEKFRVLGALSIMQPWCKWLSFFNDYSNRRKKFIKYVPGGFYVGFFRFWPLKVGIEHNYVVWRLLGFRFLKYKIGNL